MNNKGLVRTSEKKEVLGFTLVEMLVVVAIIAILSSVFLIGLRGFRGSAYDARRLSDLQKVQSYLELYYNKNRTYPSATDWTELEKELGGSNGVGINSLPKDPIASGKYYYGYCNDGQGYALGVKLNDPNSSVMNDSVGAAELSDCKGNITKVAGVCGNKATDGAYCVKF
jgi:type IV pilus assembly protein PilE